jgi:hypothetical protein
MSMPDPGEGFIRLGLAVDQHFPGYVDAYFGPMDLSHAARQRGKAPLPELIAEAKELTASVMSDEMLPPRRKEWLLGELAALQTTLRILQGEALEISAEVRLLYGVTPAWVDETTFDEAYRALDAVLPGAGPVIDRALAFRQRLRVSLDRAQPAMSRLIEDLRQRTRARFPLPPEERCEFAYVRDKPWLAYNSYKGSGRSRIDFNQDRTFYLHQLPWLLSHEAYPGHHTEQVIKEQRLFRDEGWLEHSIVLLNTPSALVSEGTATNALEVVAEPEEIVGYYADLLEAAGLPAEDASRIDDFERVGRPLDNVSGNLILLLHGEKVPENEVIAYGMRYLPIPEDEQRKQLQFLQDPLLRSYGFNYTIGRDLVEKYLAASEDRPAAFTALLTEPMTPRQLDLMAGT